MPTLSQAFVLSFLPILVQSEILDDFSTNDNGPFLPREDCCMAVGYYNGVIALIGGYDLETAPSTAVIEYDIDTETFTQSLNALSSRVGYGQYNHFWVQNGVNVYIINPDGTALQVYDLSTKTLADNWKNAAIPTRVYYQACIAYAHSVLYIMGGGDSHAPNYVLLNTVQRYDIDSSRWLSTKTMLEPRHEFSCVYSPSNDALYAIGGWSGSKRPLLSSIEYVTISEIETNAFQYTENDLSVGLSATSAVVYRTDIYILGGASRGSTDNYVYTDHIHVLDTTTNLIQLSPHKLAYSVAYTTGVLAENVIYLFGGDLDDDVLISNQLQFYKLTNTGISMATSQATSISTLPSHSDTGDPSREPIWIPIVIGVDTALVVVCMCLGYYLYQKHCIDSKQNTQMQEHQNPKHRMNIPAQNPIIVPDHVHPSMEMMAIHLATTLPPPPQQPCLLTYSHYLGRGEKDEKEDDGVSEQEEEGNDSVGVYMNRTQVTKSQTRNTTSSTNTNRTF